MAVLSVFIAYISYWFLSRTLKEGDKALEEIKVSRKKKNN